MAYTDMWEIIDNNGTIHSGTEDEMRIAFQVMQNDFKGLTGLTNKRKELTDHWQCEWIGDLKLIQIHEINR